jgi:hypothetical protein
MALPTESQTIEWLSLSGFAERDSLEDEIQHIEVWEGGVATRLLDIFRGVWADHEADKFVLLADRLPCLLSVEQEALWEFVQSGQEFWLPPLSQGLYNVSRVTFNFRALRAQWSELKAKAAKKHSGKNA